MYRPPTRSSILIIGHISPASPGLMGSISMPYDLPREAIFLNSSIRPWVRATEMLPVRLNPVSTPVSSVIRS